MALNHPHFDEDSCDGIDDTDTDIVVEGTKVELVSPTIPSVLPALFPHLAMHWLFSNGNDDHFSMTLLDTIEKEEEVEIPPYV